VLGVYMYIRYLEESNWDTPQRTRVLRRGVCFTVLLREASGDDAPFDLSRRRTLCNSN